MPTSTRRPLALVTGAGKKRVGWHVATALADAGHDLAIHYRTSATEAADTVRQLRARGVQAEAFAADLADETAVATLVQDVLQRHGAIDVLVNTAAIWERRPLEKVSAADVRRHFEVNTLGTFLTCQQVGLAMTAQESGGCIVNFGDWAEARPYLNYAAYFPSKGAIPTLTRCFAHELGHRNPRVRVNAVLPGPIMLPEDLPEPERREAIGATLVKSEGSPEDAARAVLFLVRSPFVTGVCIPVDGGRTVYARGI